MVSIFRKVLLFVFTFFAFWSFANAQGKYFKVIAKQYSTTYTSNKFYGKIAPLDENKNDEAILSFRGKSKQQLYNAVMDYLKERPGFVLKPKATTEHLITYRDFSNIGSMDSCFADLVGLTFVYVIPMEDVLKVSFGRGSEIYATIFGAKLQVTPDDNVASIGNKPFNEYKFVQPADEGVIQSRSTARNILLGGSGYKSATRSLKEAYPDSVFDPEGKVRNTINKRIIENYYDWFAADLNSFVLNYFKK